MFNWTAVTEKNDGDTLTAAELEAFAENLRFLKQRAVYIGVGAGLADITTTSTTFVSAGAPFEMPATDLELGLYLLVARFNAITSADFTNYNYRINGTTLGLGTSPIYRQFGANRHKGTLLRMVGIPAGSTTIEMVWATSATRTATILGNGYYPFMGVFRLDTF